MREPLGLFLPHAWESEPYPDVEGALQRRDYPTAVAELYRLGALIMDGITDVSLTRLASWLERMPVEWHVALTPVRALLLYQAESLTQTAIAVQSMIEQLIEQRPWTGLLPETDWVLPMRAFQGMVYAEMGRSEQSGAAFAEAGQRLVRYKTDGPSRGSLTMPPEEAQRLISLDRYGCGRLILDGLELYQTVGYPAATARICHSLAHQYLEIGEPSRARYWLERSLELRQGRPGLLPRAMALDSLGVCYRQLGMLDEAQAVLDEALRMGGRLESPVIQACCLSNLGDVYRDRDEPTTALDLYRKALALKAQLRDSYGMAVTQLSLSVLYRRQGQFGLATDAANEAVALSHSYGNVAFTDSLQLHELIAELLMGRTELAGQMAEVVARISTRHNPGEEALGRWYLAQAALLAGDEPRVRQEVDAALELAMRHRQLPVLAAELPVTAPVCRVAVEQGISPELLAGLIQRATLHGLARLLDQVPAVASIVSAAGRLAEARALVVWLLGPFRVTQAGREIDLSASRSHKAVSLFKLLVAYRGRPLLREQILDAIWPESDPEAADRSFEVTLSTLRKLLDPILGQPLILRRGRGYLINPELTVDVDVDRFTAHLERGNWWFQRGQTAPAESEWYAAEEVYRGDFLAEDPYDDWATAERERLKEQYLDLVTRLGEMDLAAGHLGDAVARANRVLSSDPIRERAFRLLMKAHTRQGNRWVAVRAYRRYTEELQRELGEEPAPETRELAKRIRAGESM